MSQIHDLREKLQKLHVSFNLSALAEAGFRLEFESQIANRDPDANAGRDQREAA
jgi:hypothetical protein